MKCPTCGTHNIEGSDKCESCHQDLSLVNLEVRNKIEKSLMSDPLSRLQPRTPISVTSGANVHDAVIKMTESKVGAVLVMDGSSLKGILTERDILFRVLNKRQDLKKIPVSDVMTSAMETLSEDDSVAFAFNKMSVGGFRHIPVMRGNQVQGIVSVRDLFRYLSTLISKTLSGPPAVSSK